MGLEWTINIYGKNMLTSTPKHFNQRNYTCTHVLQITIIRISRSITYFSNAGWSPDTSFVHSPWLLVLCTTPHILPCFRNKSSYNAQWYCLQRYSFMPQFNSPQLLVSYVYFCFWYKFVLIWAMLALRISKMNLVLRGC